MVERIGRRGQFDQLRASRRSARAGCLRVSMLAHEVDAVGGEDILDQPAVGYAIPRRVGNAVRRNRTRRRLREVLRDLERLGDLPAGDYLVSVRPTKREPSSAQLRGWIEAALSELASDGSNHD